MSSPIMMLWLDLRVRPACALPPCRHGARPAMGWRSTVPPRRRTCKLGRRRDRRPAPERRLGTALLLVSRPRMARRSLRPQLNQIRGVGPPGPHRRLDRPPARGDRPADQAFKRENELAPDGESEGAGRHGLRRRDRPARRGRRADRRRARGARPSAPPRRPPRPSAAPPTRPTRTRPRPSDEDEDDDAKRRAAAAPRRPRARRAAAARRPARGHLRPRRGGLRPVARPRRRRTTRSTPSTGPGHRPVEVTIEEDQIVIRRAGEDGDGSEDDED